MSHSQDNHAPELRTLSAKELDAVAGANIMDLIVKAAFPALTKECLYQLTRQGTVVYCPNGLGK